MENVLLWAGFVTLGIAVIGGISLLLSFFKSPNSEDGQIRFEPFKLIGVNTIIGANILIAFSNDISISVFDVFINIVLLSSLLFGVVSIVVGFIYDFKEWSQKRKEKRNHAQAPY